MTTKKKTMETKTIILIISSFFVGCIVGVFLLFVATNHPEALTTTIDRVDDAVVSIESMNGSIVEATGSGFIYKKGVKKSYILTNEHVLNGVEIKITNSKGKTIEGKILGKDKQLDLAVIEIDSKYAPQVVELGNSDKIKIGEEIFVIGSPLSRKYAGTVTKGIISGKNRTVPTDLEEEESTLLNGIQFDAAVNPGSSGGPLFNTKGEVIGICTMKFIKTEVEGMSFAIPINQATEILQTLERGKKINRPELGITMTEVSNTTELERYKIKINKKQKTGVVVLKVKKDSNADGILKKGDIITKIDDIEIKETDDVKKILRMHKKGNTIQLHIMRNGISKKIRIKLK